MNNLKYIRKGQKGITLVSLVVTIIVLLILSGITISSVVGENGILNKSKEVANATKDAQANEMESMQSLLNDLNSIIGGSYESLPENTNDTLAGTQVKLPAKWTTTTAAEVSTENGEVVKKLATTSNVIAIATGNGETVPVPKEFYYVGGTISSGVVISDDVRDQNKYAGIENVPTGVTYNSDGTVKTYTDDEYKNLLDEQKKEVLLGNQFVWIPCTSSEYKKRNWGDDYKNATWEKQTNTAELPQIQKYSGFYIGRYEAGTSGITLSTEVNFASQNTATGWVNDDFSIRDGLNHTATGKVTTKAGEIPYYHADYETALKLSNNMYQTDYVQSGLVTGTMWDMLMKFISNGTDSIVTTASNWGNYNNGNVTFAAGQGRYGAVDETNGAMTAAFAKSDGTYHYGIKTTAISEDVKKKNLYDVAGNLFEWTQEAAYPNNEIESYMLRGGSFNSSFSYRPACDRFCFTATNTYTNSGFRPALYIK